MLRPFISVLCVLLLFAPFARGAEPQLDPAAVAAVERLADFYKGLTTFSFSVRAQPLSVIKGELPTSTYTVTVQKPDKLMAEMKEKDTTVRFGSDGKTTTALTVPPNEYRQTPATEGIGPLLRRVAPGFDNLIAADPKAKFLEDVTKLTVVGQESIDNALCDRLRFEQPGAIVDLCVQTGPQPLVRRVVLRIVGESGVAVIDFRVEDWKVDLKPEASVFDFVLPAGAKPAPPEAAEGAKPAPPKPAP